MYNLPNEPEIVNLPVNRNLMDPTSFKDADFYLHCASFCAALCLFQCNSFKQHKMNQLVRKNKNNDKQSVLFNLMF